jgi:16S rRNA processing protein RimM
LIEPRVLLGVVVAAHGIKGEVKVKTFTESPDGLTAYGPLTTEAGRVLEVAALRIAKADEAVVRFAGVADRNAAEALKGQSLYVPRSVLPEAGEREFYLADLIGLRAEDPLGHPLGTVKAVHNFGAGDVLEIEFSNGKTEFVAFTDANVPTVDLASGRVVIVPPSYAEDTE